MDREPASASAALITILLNAIFWTGYAVVAALSPASMPGIMRWIVMVVAASLSAVLIGLIHFLKRRNQIAFYAGLFIFAMLTLLSITDQFGILDLISLALGWIAFILLINNRAWFLSRPSL